MHTNWLATKFTLIHCPGESAVSLHIACRDTWQADRLMERLCAKFEAEAPIHLWTACVQPINLKKRWRVITRVITSPSLALPPDCGVFKCVFKSMGHTWRNSPKPNISTVYNFYHFPNYWILWQNRAIPTWLSLTSLQSICV